MQEGLALTLAIAHARSLSPPFLSSTERVFLIWFSFSSQIFRVLRAFVHPAVQYKYKCTI